MSVAFALFASFGVADAQTALPAQERYAQVAAQLQRLAEHEVSEKHLPGLSLALVDDQQIVWAQGFGFADPEKKIEANAETAYRVGSVSKLFTDIAIMQLVERGHLDLDAPVTNYLPDFQPKNPFGTAITLRELMSHRAGLVREPPVGNYFDSTEPCRSGEEPKLSHPRLCSRDTYEIFERGRYGGRVGSRIGRPQAIRSAFARDRTASAGLENSSFNPEPSLLRNLARGYMWTYEGKIFLAPTFELGTGPAGICTRPSLTKGVFSARFLRTVEA
jgi:beta-lactamase family protein